MTLTELIDRLHELRAEYGGDLLVTAKSGESEYRSTYTVISEVNVENETPWCYADVTRDSGFLPRQPCVKVLF